MPRKFKNGNANGDFYESGFNVAEIHKYQQIFQIVEEYILTTFKSIIVVTTENTQKLQMLTLKIRIQVSKAQVR